MTEIQTIHSTPFLKMFALEGEHNDIPFHWTMCSRNDQPKFITGSLLKPDAVHIVCAVKKDGIDHLLVIAEHRHTINELEIGFPAGLVDGDEKALNSARRELKEEAGVVLDEVFHVSTVLVKSSGMSDETCQVVYCNATGELSNKYLEYGEDIMAELMTMEQVNTFINSSQYSLHNVFLDQVFHLFAKTGCIHPSQL